MSRYSAICVDAYGTLCRVGHRRRPYLRLFERLNVEARPAAVRAMTTPADFEELAAILAGGREVNLRDLRADLDSELASVEFFDDVAATLSDLRRRAVKLWVVSNLAPPYAAPLRRLLSAWSPGFTLSFEVGAVKPAAAMFHHALNGLNASAGDVMMVGGGFTADVLGGRAVGMQAVHLVRGAHDGKEDRIRVLTDLLRTGGERAVG